MRKLACLLILWTVLPVFSLHAAKDGKHPDRRIFVYGGDIELKFVEYVADLTGKQKPQLCYLPTACADNPDNIKYWERICRTLDLEPHVLRGWGDSSTQKESFEDILARMDAVVVGGGNTLNMLGIWAYQGIDTLLKNALDRGVVLSGGSAGSICWFRDGVSDSRPVSLSVVRGLGLLPYSHCPHYNVPEKRAFFEDLVARKVVPAGYACDEHAGILFTNGKVTEAVASVCQAGSRFVSSDSGKVRSIPLNTRVLLRKGALPESDYAKESVERTVKECTDMQGSMQTPLEAFITIQQLFAAGRYSEYPHYVASPICEHVKGMEDRAVSDAAAEAIRSTRIIACFTYGNFAAVLSKGNADFYSLWYFMRETGNWKCLGEDIGGDSPADAEITFREKAPEMCRTSEK